MPSEVRLLHTPPFSPVAQLAEQAAVNRWVVGSSPTRGASSNKGNRMLKVYLIEDDKYGTQAVFAKEEDAEKALEENYNDYCMSGMGVCVVEWEVE